QEYLRAMAHALEKEGQLKAARQAWSSLIPLAEANERNQAEAQRDRLDRLLAGRPWLGLSFVAGSTVVREVIPGGPGSLAGVQPGDILHHVSKVPIATTTQLAEQLRRLRAGDRLLLSLN